jgi:hypothetical protein
MPIARRYRLGEQDAALSGGNPGSIPVAVLAKCLQNSGFAFSKRAAGNPFGNQLQGTGEGKALNCQGGRGAEAQPVFPNETRQGLRAKHGATGRATVMA